MIQLSRDAQFILAWLLKFPDRALLVRSLNIQHRMLDKRAVEQALQELLERELVSRVPAFVARRTA